MKFHNCIYTKIQIVLILSLLFVNRASQSQNFVKLENVEMAAGYLGTMSWCDYTSDGYPDILVVGSDYGMPISHAGFYINNGDHTFSLADISFIPKLIYGSQTWGDLDNDGAPDLLLAGTTSGFTEDNVTKLYRNTGIGNFEEVPLEIPKLSRCHLEWVDVDNDGWNDIYYQGINADNAFDLGILKNIKNSQFEAVEINIEKISGPRGNFTINQAVWADFDNDGLKDVAISMSSQQEYDYVFYKNLGDFTFEFIDIGLPTLNYVNQKAGDFNQDGLMDLAFTGSEKITLSSVDWQADFYFFFNQGNMEFVEGFKIDNIGIFQTTLDVADYTNDGFSDVMVYGTASDFMTIRYFVNNQDGTFSDTEYSIEGAQSGSGWFADMDRDHDLDLAVTGRFDDPFDYEATYVWENLSTIINQPPLPPDTVEIFATDDNLLITWNEGTDDMTGSASLFYNLQIGTAEVPTSLMSACAMDGMLKVNNTGNLNMNNRFQYFDFPEGEFQIAVQSIDHAFNASQFSTLVEFNFKHSTHYFPDTIFGCLGDPVKLHVEGEYASYLWNTGSTDSALYVDEDGFYNVNLTDTDGRLSSETTFVNFYEKPVMRLGPNLIIATSDTVVLYPDSLYQSIVWNDGSVADSLIVIGSNYEPGIYDFWARVSNIYGCTCTDSLTVTVFDDTYVEERNKAFGFAVYPNPAEDNIQIICKEPVTGACNLGLFNTSGEEIFTSGIKLNTGRVKIELPGIDRGIYILRFTVAGNSYTEKLIIR